MSALIADRFDEASRVKLGASPQATPAMLALLADDPAITVRAAVALNDATPHEVRAQLVHDGDERIRVLLARKLAGCALGKAEKNLLQGQAVLLLEDLVRDEAVRVRQVITEVLKEMPNAPKDVVLRLAEDAEMSVSEPIIRLSPLLTTEDLLALLAAPPAPGTVTAIARRPHLAEVVSAAVAATASSAAIHALLCNRSAAIREATLDSLIAQSVHHCEWHEPLVQRPALPPKAARALADVVATQYLELLARRADLPPELVRELEDTLALRLRSASPQDEAPRLTAEQAIAKAAALKAEGRLTEETVLGAAQRGEARLASALLALAADMPFAAIERAASLRSAKGLISLCWKAGFSMRAAGPLQSLLCRIPPGEVLAAGSGGNFPLSPAEMRWQIEFLGRAGR